jgi:ADP-ribose pyrophosphatase
MVRKTFVLPNHTTAEYDIMQSKSFASVAAITTDAQVILVRQFRPGPEKLLVGFVDGQIDHNETPIAAARRELLEEAGYTPQGEIVHLKTVFEAYTNIAKHIFFAKDCVQIAEPTLDDNEFLETVLMSIKDFKNLIFDAQNTELTHPDVGLLMLHRLGVL